MTRIFLGGKGEPIPELAMPDVDLGSVVLKPMTVAFETNGTFDPDEYIAMGYTHCEVWCVGAAGGRGGDGVAAYGAVRWATHYFAGGVSHYGDPYLDPTMAISWGGGGGGGGFHHLVSTLADLPGPIPVTVGAVGADALPGIIDLDGTYAVPYTPVPPIDGYSQIIDTNHAFGFPGDGGDGGASTFGTLGKASGGKGGKGTLYRRHSRTLPDNRPYERFNGRTGGDGGQGGIGGRTLAGGGASGATAEPTATDYDIYGYETYSAFDYQEASDGSWDGSVGQGGGGGRGGTYKPSTIYYPGLGA